MTTHPDPSDLAKLKSKFQWAYFHIIELRDELVRLRAQNDEMAETIASMRDTVVCDCAEEFDATEVKDATLTKPRGYYAHGANDEEDE